MAKKGLLILTILSFVLVGCAKFTGVSTGEIQPPKCLCYPLQGKWLIVQELDPGVGKTDAGEDQWVGANAQFASNVFSLGEYVWGNTSYKIKRVAVADYLKTKYISPDQVPGLKDELTDVITVYSDLNFLGEFVKLNENDMIFFLQENSFLLRRLSEVADDLTSSAGLCTYTPGGIKNGGKSGVLLGMRIPSPAGHTYQTLWVANDGNQVRPVLMAQQIFSPRTSGFWELSVLPTPDGVESGTVLNARNIATKYPETQNTKIDGQEGVQPSVIAINYIGNDYIAVEREVSGINKLQVLPVDKLMSKVVNVQDLLEEEGFSAYTSAVQDVIRTRIGADSVLIGEETPGENFGLARKNGHWFLVGRVNYQEGGESREIDFELKVIPPASLIFYDTLSVNWNRVKDRVPDALDAFASPDNDIIIVKTKNKLLVFNLGNEQLSENPLAEIDLREGADIIMAEWATGVYVDNWEKSFVSYGAKSLPNNFVRIR